MADTDRAEAQRRREDARRRRRDAEDSGDSPESADTAAGNGGPEEEPHAALRNAAKAAAAGAALGAAVGAALASRDAPSEDEDSAPRRDAPEGHSRAAAVQEQDPQPEVDEEGEQVEDEADEPAAAAEPTDDASRAEPPGERDAGAPRQGASPDETVDVARRAREQLQALHGREPESVSALERTAQGWSVTIEVVELPRVPDSTDVMASYELLLDEDKNLIRYSRRRRYYRSQADRGEE